MASFEQPERAVWHSPNRQQPSLPAAQFAAKAALEMRGRNATAR